MKRTYNFGAGPAMLPESILKEAQEELLNWQNLGMSVLEIGHRTEEFKALLKHAEQTLCELLNIPTNYRVLFLGGAARTQFAMIPLNLVGNKPAGYIVTGIWSKLALQEAQHLKQAYCIASTEENKYLTIPVQNDLAIQDNSAYIYYTPNETINGVRFPYVPKVKGLPLIADMTSCLLSEPIDIRQYDLIFAGAQKNIANAGLTVVIIREELLEQGLQNAIPTMLDYRVHLDNHSLYATPPVFNCYIAAKMFDWVKAQGGVDALFAENCRKAAKLYQYLDQANDFYTTSVMPEARSIMNVCFSLKNTKLEGIFLEKAKHHGLSALKGHRMVGGLRASLYNAMPMSGVDALVHFMQEFAEEYS
ncbi:3-phosphoserine/phosphohydroxythreonine transaminase [Legionella sp. km772]|nr:3-phosphoserine/phosphohydroxythreonine transaminase [Legionella sp. km772]